MNDRAIFVLLNKVTGEIDHVWESGHLPDESITDQVPVVAHVHDENDVSSPSPDHVAIRVLECPDIDPQDLQGLSRAEYLRKNCIIDWAPLDISSSPEERLSAPGLSRMPDSVATKVQTRLSEVGIQEGRDVPSDPEAAARTLRYVGALKRRS